MTLVMTSKQDQMSVGVHITCFMLMLHLFHRIFGKITKIWAWTQIYKQNHEISGSNTVLRDVPGCALTIDHIQLLLHQGHRTHQL